MSVEQAILALVEVVGSHPDFNGPLGDALKRRGVSLSAPAFFCCQGIGAAYTTPRFLLRDADGWEARAGIAIMGSTNMKDEDLARLSPFDKEFYDNYAQGRGATPAEALKAMDADRCSIADSLFAE